MRFFLVVMAGVSMAACGPARSVSACDTEVEVDLQAWPLLPASLVSPGAAPLAALGPGPCRGHGGTDRRPPAAPRADRGRAAPPGNLPPRELAARRDLPVGLVGRPLSTGGDRPLRGENSRHPTGRASLPATPPQQPSQTPSRWAGPRSRHPRPADAARISGPRFFCFNDQDSPADQSVESFHAATAAEPSAADPPPSLACLDPSPSLRRGSCAAQPSSACRLARPGRS
jgi:hypothetical protein